MGLMKIPTYAGGGNSGLKFATGYYESNASTTIITTDDTTGETFEPKKLIVTFRYSSYNVTCIYDADRSTTSYVRRRNGDQITLNIPRSDDYIGLGSVTSTGFVLINNGNTLTDLSYMAEG